MKLGKLGKLIRISGPNKVYCTGVSHISLASSGSWLVVDKYLRINHDECVPMEFQVVLTHEVRGEEGSAMNPHDTTHTVTHWHGQEALSRIDGLSLDAAHEIAGANSAVLGTCTVDADGLDYREVWKAGILVRQGPFAEATLVVVPKEG